jgi:hypothetical protein
VMFRYSRDVKRCGPGTKAGAPVGVVYCLSTSSFFISTLTLELDVSAFGIGDTLATVSRRSAPAASTDLRARHGKPDDCEVLVPETGPSKISRVAAELVRARLPYEGVAYQAFLDSIAARASAKLSRIRSRMILGASVLDFWTSSATSLVFLTVASNMRLANSACFVMTS